MPNRSPFLRSTCLVLLVALCFGAMGAVQAAPMRYDLSEKLSSHRMQDQSSFQMPAKNTSVPASYSRADVAGAVNTWKRDLPIPGSIVRENTPVSAPSIAKGPQRFNFTIPERSHGTNPVRERAFNQSVGKSSLVSTTGTVVYMDLEGGFYGIVADDGTRYLPDTLPESCKVDGIRVKFTGMEKTGVASISMWGTSLRILSAVPLGEEVRAKGRIEYFDLAGGFYGIVCTDGRSFLPLNLNKEFQVDGMEVSFTARTVPDTLGIYMWGIPVTIISISASQEEEKSAGSSLIGQWTLVGMDRGGVIAPVIQGSVITAAFSADGRVSGTAGCNLYFAPFEQNGATLRIGPAGSTEMYCSDTARAIMKQESTFLELLGSAASWKIRDGDLVISDSSGREILVFSPGIEDISDRPEPLIEFWRTGGFAGNNDHLEVYPDGKVSLTRKDYSVSFALSEAELEEISTLLVSSGFMGLSPEYRAPPGSADLFLYQIRAHGKTVLVEDTVIPEALQPLVDALSRIVGENAPDDIAPPRAH